MAEDHTPSLTPYIQEKIPVTQPVSFFGQKDLPEPKKTTQDYYREYNEIMERVDAAAEERRQALREARQNP